MEKETSADGKETPELTVKIKEEPRDDVKVPRSWGPPPRPEGDSNANGSPMSGFRTTAIDKDFAENTMNELLGWYGYDKVEIDESESQGLNLRRFAAGQTPSPAPSSADLHRDTASNSSADSHSNAGTHSPSASSDLAAHHQTLVSALKNGKSGKSGEASYIVCAWCQKTGMKLFTLKTPSGTKVFCSEVCFTQCRRASFKKNKICDWCKHVRHTVNYVDFQDGDQQLQFCSPKCLNQYKMNIFCRETQEHLQQIQSQMESGTLPAEGSANQILITPELWLQQQRKENSEASNSDEEEKPLNLHSSSNHSRPSSAKDGSDSQSHEEIVIAPEKAVLEDSKVGILESVARNSITEPPPITISHRPSEHRLHKEIRDRAQRRHRIRDSLSTTPLSVATSPSPSQLSVTSSSAGASSHTSPVVNGTSPNNRAAAMSMLPPGMPYIPGFPGPGGFPNQPFLYPHMLAAGGLPVMFPPAGLMAPEHAAAAAAAHSQQKSSQQRASASSPEVSNTTPRASTHTSSQAGLSSQQAIPPSMMGPRPPVPGLPPFPHLPPGVPFPHGMPPYGMMPPHPMAGMVPPATLMVPYPVVLPIPVPIPIPVPVRNDKELAALMSLAKSPPKQASTPRPKPSTPKPDRQRPASTPATTTTPEVETPKTKIRCACCQSESQTDGHCPSRNHKSSPSEMMDMKEASKPPMKAWPPSDSECARITSSSDMEDVVIDLSTDRNSSPRDRHQSTPVLTPVSQNTIPLREESPIGPLVSGLPGLLPPRDTANSRRRGLILDAPSISRDRKRSPSPEKRILLRSPSREMLFGKRRCLRRSIKTK